MRGKEQKWKRAVRHNVIHYYLMKHTDVESDETLIYTNIESQSWPFLSVPDSTLEATKKPSRSHGICVSVNCHFATERA